MSLLDPLSGISKYSPFSGSSGPRQHWGKVISNKDPKMLQRIKVAIDELIPWEAREGDEAGKDVLPWVYPQLGAGLGQGPLTSPFCVPEEESYVTVIFPYNTIYMGYYTGQPSDRLRRPNDFLSEYPERYGWQDSRENKFIVNKDPEIDTVEHRFADGGLSTYDSKHGLWTYRDDYGTDVHVDRKNQSCDIKFGGVRLQITEGTFRIESEETELQGDIVSLLGEMVTRIKTASFNVNAKSVSSMAEKFHDGLSRTYETLDRE